MSDVVINDTALLALVDGPIMDHVWDVAGDVVLKALDHASGRPGPNIITGDLLRHIHRERSIEGHFIDIGSDSDHGGGNYPSFLEIGYTHYKSGRFIHYPWLLPALKDVFGADVKINTA